MYYGSVKNVGDIAIYAASISYLKFKIHNDKKFLRMSIVAVLLLTMFFGYVQYSRLENNNWAGGEFTSPAYIDYDHVLFKAIDFRLAKTITLMSGYLSHGYYGLSLCLKLPFVWTYGVGNSFALSQLLSHYFNVENVMYNTYPLRMESTTGWPALLYWSTIFTWLASDFTFIGALIFLSLLAVVWGRTWKESISCQNPLSIVLFSHLNIMWLFVPANNQLMQTVESTISTIVLFLIWILFHRKFNAEVSVNNLPTYFGEGKHANAKAERISQSTSN